MVADVFDVLSVGVHPRTMGDVIHTRRVVIRTNGIVARHQNAVKAPEQLAWLKARLPAGVASPVLAAQERLPEPLAMDDGKVLEPLIIGKRKPLLSWQTDRARIERHAEANGALLRRCNEDLNAGEPAGPQPRRAV